MPFVLACALAEWRSVVVALSVVSYAFVGLMLLFVVEVATVDVTGLFNSSACGFKVASAAGVSELDTLILSSLAEAVSHKLAPTNARISDNAISKWCGVLLLTLILLGFTNILAVLGELYFNYLLDSSKLIWTWQKGS